MLPDGDGIDTLDAVRALHPDMPVIVLSAQNTLDTAVRASGTGAFEYFPKPFDIDELARTVRQAVGAQAQAAERERRRGRRSGAAAGRTQRADAGGLPDDHPGAAQRSDRADPGRIGHRQGTGRRGDPPAGPPRQRAVRRGQHCGDPRRADRKRAVRPREGRLHRRGRAPHRQVRAGRRRHAVPRRNRRHADAGADPAAARAAIGQHPPGRRTRGSPRRCPHRRGDQPRSRTADRRRPVPRGSVLPDQRGADQPAAAARAARRCRGAGPALPPACRRRGPAAPPADRRRRRAACPPALARQCPRAQESASTGWRCWRARI